MKKLRTNDPADKRPPSRLSAYKMWDNYGFDVMMFHLFSSKLSIYLIFLMGINVTTYLMYGLIDIGSPSLLLGRNLFTVMQSYRYGWISFITQLAGILVFVLYTKFLMLHRKSMLQMQRLTHIDVSSYAIFMHNIRASLRDEEIITRINKELIDLRGTFVTPEALRYSSRASGAENKETLSNPLVGNSNSNQIKRIGRTARGGKQDKMVGDQIEHVYTLERIRDLRVYNARRKLAKLQTQYYNQIKNDPRKLILKERCTISCLKCLGIFGKMQCHGLMRDHVWYKQAIRKAKINIQSLEAASTGSSRGMAIVTFKAASARNAFLRYRRSCFASKVITIKGSVINLYKAPPPSEVNWDNVHRSRGLFVIMFLCSVILSSLLTAIVYLIISVIRAYQRIIMMKTTSALLSLTLSGSIYLVILIFDFMGKVLMHRIVQLERHHTVSAHEQSYMLRYFLYIFANRLTPLYSRTILDYLDKLLNHTDAVTSRYGDEYFFQILDFTKMWRWGNDTPGRDMLLYMSLATIFDNTLDIVFHYLQPSSWSGCRRKKDRDKPPNKSEQELLLSPPSSPSRSSETNELDVVEARYYCGWKWEFCRVRTQDEERKRLKLGYHTLYCRMATVLAYTLAYSYAQPVILPIACMYFILQNIIGKIKLIYFSKLGRRATTSLSLYFSTILLTFSYLFAAATLAQGYLVSTSVSSLTAIAITMPTVILFSVIFNTATINKILMCRCCRRKSRKVAGDDAKLLQEYAKIRREIEEERQFGQLPLYDKEEHGQYAYIPEIGYSEKECLQLDTILGHALANSSASKAGQPRATKKPRESPHNSMMRASSSIEDANEEH